MYGLGIYLVIIHRKGNINIRLLLLINIEKLEVQTRAEKVIPDGYREQIPSWYWNTRAIDPLFPVFLNFSFPLYPSRGFSIYLFELNRINVVACGGRLVGAAAKSTEPFHQQFPSGVPAISEKTWPSLPTKDIPSAL